MATEDYRWKSDAPLVIAHRGASSIAPESTLHAFRCAVEGGADAVEMDLKLSRDGVIVVHHDQSLDRTTDGKGFVADWTWSELSRLDAGIHYGAEFLSAGIPRLQDVFDEMGDRLLYNLELTEYRRPFTSLTEDTVELVRAYDLEECVLYSSFSPIELFRAARLVDRERLALLVHERTPAFTRALMRWITPHAFFHPSDEMTTQQLIDQSHAGGKSVNVWTVNEHDRMRDLFEWGADGLITDAPDIACRIRAELES
ncbi:MAG: glycerophosphodiester phosphodiesterase family protein [Anaerolineales bacterium]|nr:glycerophosphodiester phosphodiesterase family protein [Anaerolineales bacterium]